MENDKFQDLFDDFRPGLSPDSTFMSRLSDKLHGVELIREHQRTVARSNRLALVAAAAVGFAVGVAFALLMPYIGSIAANMRAAAGDSTILRMLVDNYRLAIGLVICATSVFTALNAYEFTMALQRRRFIRQDIP